ncbi:MAG: sialidase family protein [Opitutaceae bacterium]
MKVPLVFLTLLLVTVGAKAAGRTEIPNAAQPQLCAASDGRVWLAYGQGDAVFVARSDDGGATFSSASKVAAPAKLALGMRRGPRIAARGDRVTVTMIGDELFAFSSIDGGKTWSAPVTINEVPAAAREGLHDLGCAPDGGLFVTWLDLRNGATELWGAASSDGGRTWTKNQQVYHSSDKSICECCHPTALFDAAGNLAVMWRNAIAGSRDMWLATRANGAKEFSPARKLGTGTWKLDACPMDGGKVIALGAGKFAAVWQRAGEVFFCPAQGAEIGLGPGTQPVAIAAGAQPLVVWQRGADLFSARVGANAAPAKHASDGRFPALVSLTDGRGALLAYERGPAKEPRIVVERL